MEEPLIAFRNSGDEIPAAAGGPATPSSVSSAQAEFDRIFANPNRTEAESERAVELLRQSLGEAGRQIGTPAPDDGSVAAAADVPSSRGAVKEPSDLALVEAEPQSEASVLSGMVADSLMTAAPTLGERLGVEIAPEYAQGIISSLTPSPDGYPRTLGDELQHGPEDSQARHEIEARHRAGWDALRKMDGFPLSAEVEAERHGYHFHPKAFAFLVRLGAHVRERQEAEQLKLAETRSGDKRVHDPGQRR